MKKYILIAVFILLVAFFFVSRFSKKSSVSFPNAFPTVTPVGGPGSSGTPTSPLDITSTDPVDKTMNVPINQPIRIIFARPFSLNEISFASNPQFPYSSQIEGNTLIITPKQPYSPGATYTYSINYTSSSSLSKTFSFVVAGPTQQYLPNTRDTHLYDEEQNYQRENYPDVYVANHTPYSTNDFSISYESIQSPIHFTVTLLGGDKTASKNAFLAWLSSLGLTKDQITTLSISYQ